MVLGASEIYKRIIEDEMISGIDDYEFKIEGATVDVRLDKLFAHGGGAEFYDDKRNVGNIHEIPPIIDISISDNKIFFILPNEVYLVSTMEKVNMPVNILAHIDTRTTMFRSGMILKATYTNPGYKGHLTFLLINHGKSAIPLQRGVRIAQVAFHEVKGSCEPYNGLWNHGRIHTDNKFAAPR